jgi:hypothetical protein
MTVITNNALIATIDLDASDVYGYPIEVGVAMFDPGRAYLSVWSSLIRPTREWRRSTGWSVNAEKLHGLGFAEVADAERASVVGRRRRARRAVARASHAGN